jgi:hypothetical protein
MNVNIDRILFFITSMCHYKIAEFTNFPEGAGDCTPNVCNSDSYLWGYIPYT